MQPNNSISSDCLGRTNAVSSTYGKTRTSGHSDPEVVRPTPQEIKAQGPGQFILATPEGIRQVTARFDDLVVREARSFKAQLHRLAVVLTPHELAWLQMQFNHAFDCLRRDIAKG